MEKTGQARHRVHSWTRESDDAGPKLLWCLSFSVPTVWHASSAIDRASTFVWLTGRGWKTESHKTIYYKRGKPQLTRQAHDKWEV